MTTGHKGRVVGARAPTAADPVRLAHHLGNTISALKLRLQQVAGDSTCMWAQGENIEAMSHLLDEAMNGADRLEQAVRLLAVQASSPGDKKVRRRSR